MEHSSNAESMSNMTFDDYDNVMHDQQEVTEGLFSRCEKKKEEKKTEKVLKKEGRCGCAPKPKKRKSSRAAHGKRKSRSRSRKSKRALNAFILFYLELFAKSSGKHVTCVAIDAGKKWCSMSEKEKEKYIQMAIARKKEKMGRKGGKC